MNVAKETMNIVIVGHVDHGKSSVIGRLLYETNSLPEGKLEQIKAMCKRDSKTFEYAFLLDALGDERAQGITIDIARCFFKTKKRNYIILDAPGHKEFLKNMVTGAARAEAALLVIEANEGIQENSKRHAYLLSMMGIKQVTVLVNKMDLVDYSHKKFLAIQDEYGKFLTDIGIDPKGFIPISALKGDNITNQSSNMKWYKGHSVQEAIDSFKKEKDLSESMFRMYLQGVYKFTAKNEGSRVCVGKVDSGDLNIGDEIIFLPSMKRSKVKTFESLDGPAAISAGAGESIAFSLEEQIYVKRGELVCRMNEPVCQVLSNFKANIFWMSHSPMMTGKSFKIKIGTAEQEVELVEVIKSIDTQNLNDEDKPSEVARYEVAQCHFRTLKPIPFDFVESHESTSRFVIVDNYEIVGGGIIIDSLNQKESDLRHELIERELHLIKGKITDREKVGRYGQRSALILITGGQDDNRKELATKLEEYLFRSGRFVNFIGMGSLKYGIGVDIDESSKSGQHEYVRRLGQLAYLFLEAGLISIITARDLNKEEITEVQRTIGGHEFIPVVYGDTEEMKNTLILDKGEKLYSGISQIIAELEKRQIFLGLQQ